MNENPQTPEEVGQWLRDHGGPARSEGPDANGIVTQHAADGSYLRQQALPGGNTRVLEVKPAGAAVPGGDGSAPATTAPRGAGMDQKQLEALLAQMGPLGAGDFREEVKTEEVANPDYKGEATPLIPPTIKQPVTYRTWVKPGTNQRLTVKVNPDGVTYTQTFSGADTSIKPDAATADTPAARNAKRDEDEESWNADPANRAAGGSGRRETHRARDERLAKEKKEAAAANKPPTATERVGSPTGNTDTVTRDGKTIKRIEYILPDGTKEWREQAAPADTRGGKLPPGVNPPRFSRGNVAAELNRFNRELDAAVSRGEITKEEATGFYTPYHQEAQTYLSEQNYGDSQDQNAVSSQLTQRSQNLTTAGNRATWSNSAFQNAATQDNNLLMGAAGTGKSALVPLLTLQAGLANAAGGFRDQPEIEVRRFPAVGANVPASIKPAIDAAAVAPSGVAAGLKPAPLIAPAPPASAEAARQQQAAGGGAAAPNPVLAPPPGVAASMPKPQAADGNERDDDVLTVQGQQGMAQEMTRSQWNAMSNKSGLVVTNARPNPARMATPAMPSGQSLAPGVASPTDPNGEAPVFTPVPPVFTPPSISPQPQAAGGGNVQMAPPSMPRSIQAAMPQQQSPDVDSIVERMLADGVPYEDAMEIRRRYRVGAAA